MFIMKTTILCIKNNVHHEDNYTLYKEHVHHILFVIKDTLCKEQCSS